MTVARTPGGNTLGYEIISRHLSRCDHRAVAGPPAPASTFFVFHFFVYPALERANLLRLHPARDSCDRSRCPPPICGPGCWRWRAFGPRVRSIPQAHASLEGRACYEPLGFNLTQLSPRDNRPPQRNFSEAVEVGVPLARLAGNGGPRPPEPPTNRGLCGHLCGQGHLLNLAK